MQKEKTKMDHLSQWRPMSPFEILNHTPHILPAAYLVANHLPFIVIRKSPHWHLLNESKDLILK